ncbi:hypothetical protein HPB51_024157 [Rhipicephalus microplus]|uniref:Uncharacterized protein n=1 Tax=Rhipicephalus microplus TaxID=6941 RepID=A0A9J6DDK8_RHIMP|nr:hypothetical protein HPB51_024157 [Rhipicephalus microplus]
MPAARALGQRRASQKGLQSGKSELGVRSPKTGRPEPPPCSRPEAQQKRNAAKASQEHLVGSRRPARPHAAKSALWKDLQVAIPGSAHFDVEGSYRSLVWCVSSGSPVRGPQPYPHFDSISTNSAQLKKTDHV